jgi:hypothetical protein
MSDLTRSLASALLTSALLAGALAASAVPALAGPAHASSHVTSPVEKSKKKWVRYRVSPGAFCSERGWYGKTKTGLTMRCKTSSTDSRYRWRR